MVGGFVLSELFTKLISTSGAVLLFSKNIDEYPDFRLRMARFVGTDKNMFRDNQRAEGNFFEFLQAGIDFCFKHLSLSGRITNIKEPHESFPHNLNVAEALFRMTYLENWGSGARRIIDAYRVQNIEEPTWCDNGGFITVTFKRPFYKPIEDSPKDTV